MQDCLKVFALALLLIAQGSQAQIRFPDDNSCYTPDRHSGSCVNIKSCKSLLDLLQQKPLTQQAIQFLQRSQCGFQGNDPKVCCVTSSMSDSSTTTGQPSTDSQVPNVANHPNLRLLDNTRCGPINRDKIVGGNRTAVNEFPWMALLAYDTGAATPEFRCGGSVINKRYILTAAHCVTKLPAPLELVGVRVGEHDITKERDCDFEGTEEEICAERYQDFTIENVQFHPGFSKLALHNDIALIRVNRDIDFRPSNSKPICLPLGTAGRISTTKLTVAGWGVTEQRISSPVMLKVNLPRFSHEECANVYRRQTVIWEKQMCMGGQQGQDSCSGDSGGPLLGPAVYNGSPRYVQYGIVSFGVRSCGIQGFPGVYTRVDYYMDWILNNMRD